MQRVILVPTLALPPGTEVAQKDTADMADIPYAPAAALHLEAQGAVR